MARGQLQQHTVIVGGGVAGLTAATYLARDGERVTLVEKGATPGGRASTDHVGGFAFNRGAHALYPGGAASEVLRELGVSYTYGVPKRVFALDDGHIHPFPQSPMSMLRTRLFGGAEKRELLGFVLRTGTVSAASVRSTSIADFIDQHARRPRVRALVRSVARVVVYTAALDLASAETFVARFQRATRYAAQYVDGGWQTIVDGLANAALGAGVVIRTSTGVESVRIDNGRATGVQLNGGGEVAADSVLLALPPTDALHLLGAPAAPALAHAVGGMVAAHIACLDVALERLPNPRMTAVFDVRQPRFVTAQSTVARVAPTGGGLIHTLKQLHPSSPTDQHADARGLEDALDQIQPGWRELVVERRFLPRMLASSLLPLASQGGLAGRPPYQSQDLPNVYFAGDWVGPHGYLVDTSFDSAREAARLILGSAEPRRLLGRAA
jgi:phytoene dehydrogenase-like protein